MRPIEPLRETRTEHGDVVVARPLRTDAIGSSLRRAFDQDHRVPGDFCRLLHALDAVR